MSIGQKILAMIAKRPGATVVMLITLLSDVKATSISAYCSILLNQGQVRRRHNGTAWEYYPLTGKMPPSASKVPARKCVTRRAKALEIPVELARQVFEVGTAGVPHAEGALGVAWSSFLALGKRDREEFRRAVVNYLLAAGGKKDYTRGGIDRAAEATSRSQSAGRGHTGEGALRLSTHALQGPPQPSSPDTEAIAQSGEKGHGAKPAGGAAKPTDGRCARQKIEDMLEERRIAGMAA